MSVRLGVFASESKQWKNEWIDDAPTMNEEIRSESTERKKLLFTDPWHPIGTTDLFYIPRNSFS